MRKSDPIENKNKLVTQQDRLTIFIIMIMLLIFQIHSNHIDEITDLITVEMLVVIIITEINVFVDHLVFKQKHLEIKTIQLQEIIITIVIEIITISIIAILITIAIVITTSIT